MTGWRARLAAIRAPTAPAGTVVSPAAGANDAIGTIDNGMKAGIGRARMGAPTLMPRPNGTTGAIGIRVEAQKRAVEALPSTPPVLSDADLYLTGLAVRLDVAVRGGATVTSCPSGALDVTLTDGSPWLLSPSVVARLEAGRLLPATAPNLPAPGAREVPAAAWRELPHGAERGVAFSEARTMPGACPCCAGRRWWREADEDPPGRCSTCHPSPPGLARKVMET